MAAKKTYVIAVALQEGEFNHHLVEPKPMYDTREEAQRVLEDVVARKEFKREQLKLLQLWILEPKN